MRVLVTGASGFIGRNVLLRAPRDWQVVAVYHSTGGLDDFIERNGLARVGSGRLPKRFLETSPPDGGDADVTGALIEERREGR